LVQGTEEIVIEDYGLYGAIGGIDINSGEGDDGSVARKRGVDWERVGYRFVVYADHVE
jgi:hypothetical protein